MNDTSDVDFLVVAEGLPDGRINRVRDMGAIERALQPLLREAQKQSVYVELSPVIKTPAEVKMGSCSWICSTMGKSCSIAMDFYRVALMSFELDSKN